MSQDLPARPRERYRAANAFPGVERLGHLPDEFIYYDDFSGEKQTLLAPAGHDVWVLHGSGRTLTIDFGGFDGVLRRLLKHWALWALSSSTHASVYTLHRGNEVLRGAMGPEVFLDCLRLHPMELSELWHGRILPQFTQGCVRGLKSFLHFCCEKSLGQLRPNHADFVGSFRLPTKDKYSAVRNGAVFLSMHEESQLVDYFDALNSRVRSDPGTVSVAELRASCVLLTSYQHAFRPLQLRG